ncbi:unnamed protein product [Zymoseptoria tritici ST99CH_1A5]|uniref:Chitin-binding type-1 domain-containing protein n=3 Tax=Zymoseptoria tritici TaxID=1047171 RepID=A0A1X7RLY9_ZYMT9|nr:unnamed protein product [Zymoseptoria tritici ST99CH_3D7]SMR48333.1 unnamed protein product [Zymoseptoria tritici ST99CH_1E4]SMY22122.1 unnamed protein product [Zymoseptoria tritici ST99CH_1A5]
MQFIKQFIGFALCVALGAHAAPAPAPAPQGGDPGQSDFFVCLPSGTGCNPEYKGDCCSGLCSSLYNTCG